MRKHFLEEILSRLPKPSLRWEAVDDWAAGRVLPGDQVARNKQLPPDHPKHSQPWTHPRTGEVYRCASPHGPDGTCPDWDVWIFMAGRGTGKTLAGANWTLSMAREKPRVWVGVCAPTFADIKNVCFEGTSGLLNVAQPGEIVDYNKNGLKQTLNNGSVIQGYSAEKPDSIRGANLYGAWFDEMAMIRYMKFYDYGLEPALRIGAGRLMVTTTPRRMKLIRALVAQSKKDPLKVHLTEATSDENPEVEKMVRKMREKYAGTFLERQELGGELLDEVDGALFTVDMFSEYRIFEGEQPEFRRVVVAIDPATTASDSSDETGICVVAEGANRHFYTLDDCSLRGSPETVMSAAVDAFRRWDADCIVGEINGVGDYMKTALHHIDPYVPFRSVRGLKGKYARAEPVSILAQQGKVHMVGTAFDKLEEQLCVARGTLISTVRGDIPVENVRTGDLALTRTGWHKVTWAGGTGIRETIRIETGAGTLTCTPDHPVYVADRGFVLAKSIRKGDMLVLCRSKSSARMFSSEANFTSGTPEPVITGRAAHAAESSSIVTNGKLHMGRSQKDGMSITEITTGKTMTWTTSSRSVPVSISGLTELAGHGQISRKSSLNEQRISGAGSGMLVLFPQHASTAAQNSAHGHRVVLENIAVTDVVQNTVVEPVYDLTVENAHEFFAGGFLVHNCAFSSDDDRTVMHDDRADAWVWGMLELSGISQQINYREMYGFIACANCGEQVHEKDPKCSHCGAEVEKPEPAPAPRNDERRWSAAYLNTCKTCGTQYNMREKRCPQCNQSPQAYLGQVGRFSGTIQGRHSYMERDWFRGKL